MTHELQALENKVTQVVNLCHSLRAENDRLKVALAESESDRQDYANRIEAARHRLEELARQLPQSPDGA